MLPSFNFGLQKLRERARRSITYDRVPRYGQSLNEVKAWIGQEKNTLVKHGVMFELSTVKSESDVGEAKEKSCKNEGNGYERRYVGM